MGINRERLGSLVGLACQQIQQYERGAIRISASQLYEFSAVLDVNVSFFFEDMPSELIVDEKQYVAGIASIESTELRVDPPTHNAMRESVRNCYAQFILSSQKTKSNLIKFIAKTGLGEPVFRGAKSVALDSNRASPKPAFVSVLSVLVLATFIVHLAWPDNGVTYLKAQTIDAPQQWASTSHQSTPLNEPVPQYQIDTWLSATPIGNIEVSAR